MYKIPQAKVRVDQAVLLFSSAEEWPCKQNVLVEKKVLHATDIKKRCLIIFLKRPPYNQTHT